MTSRKLFKIPSTIKKSAIAATAIALGIVTIASPTIAIAERANSRPTRTNTRSPRQVSPGQIQTPEKLKINYKRSSNPINNQYIEGLKQSRILDNLVSALNSQVGNRLPREIPITVEDCGRNGEGQANGNASYNYYRQTTANASIKICSEFIQDVDLTFKEPTPLQNISPEDARRISETDKFLADNSLRLTYSTMSSTLLHEAGHMLIHQLNLPVLGKNEDAADLFSAYFVLELLPRTNINGVSLASSQALYYLKKSQKEKEEENNPNITSTGAQLTPEQRASARFVDQLNRFLGEHPPDEKRAGTFMCAVSSNPTYKAALLQELGQRSELYKSILSEYLDKCSERMYEPSKKAWDYFLFGTPPTVPNPGQRG
jgi:hypothetical protein